MAVITPIEIPLVGVQFKSAFVKQTAQNDDVVFSDAGVHVFSARLYTGAAASFTRNSVTAANSVTVTASQTSLDYTGALADGRLEGDYYAKIDNELIYVGDDDGYDATSGTMSAIVRGALGTTAATHDADATVTIMNSINLADNQTNHVEIIWAAFPPDPRGVDTQTLKTDKLATAALYL